MVINEHLRRMADEMANEAYRNLAAQLEDAALDALSAGRDWCEGFATDISGPRRRFYSSDAGVSLMMHGGSIPPGSPCPPGYRVIRHADWVAAGKPGLPDRPPIDI